MQQVKRLNRQCSLIYGQIQLIYTHHFGQSAPLSPYPVNLIMSILYFPFRNAFFIQIDGSIIPFHIVHTDNSNQEAACL